MRTNRLAPIAALCVAVLLGAGKPAKNPPPAPKPAPETAPESLPENIKDAVHKLLPSGTIVSYEHQVDDTRHLFFIDVQTGDKNVTVLYSGRAQYLGQVTDDAQEENDVYLDKDTAPQPVKDAIAKYFGTTPIDFLFMEVEKEKFIFCAEQTPTGKKTLWANFNLAGELVSEETEIDLKDLPANVKAAITAAHPTSKIDSATTVKEKGVTSYAADVKDGKAAFEVTVTADGKVTVDEPAEEDPPPAKP